MINSRDVNELHPQVKGKCLNFINKCRNEMINVIITSTYRDYESQSALYDIGRTKPGRKVTNAKAGHSFHNHRVAFDFVPVINGRAQWDDIKLITKCGEIAELCGLEWAGRWVSFKELLHCQYTGGLTIADFLAGKDFDNVV